MAHIKRKGHTRAESEEMETEWPSVVRETKVLRGSQGQGVSNYRVNYSKHSNHCHEVNIWHLTVLVSQVWVTEHTKHGVSQQAHLSQYKLVKDLKLNAVLVA
jgi:hypothetical protein